MLRYLTFIARVGGIYTAFNIRRYLCRRASFIIDIYSFCELICWIFRLLTGLGLFLLLSKRLFFAFGALARVNLGDLAGCTIFAALFLETGVGMVEGIEILPLNGDGR